MTRLIYILIAALSCTTFNNINAQEQPLNLTGTVKNVSDGTIYLHRFENKMFQKIDSADIRNGRFTFSTSVKLPELYGLSIEEEASPYYLFLNDGPVSVELDTARYYRNTKVKGSTDQDIYLDFRKGRNKDIGSLIEKHPSSLATAYLLYRDFSYRLKPEEIRTYLKQLDPKLSASPYVTVLNELVGVLETVSIGKKAPDFESVTPDGKKVSLNSQLGKNYILLDFWAAWCPPCRKENPNVVAAYNKFHEKGFEVIGVSLDKKKEAWEKAISDDGLNWLQLSDLAFWNSAAAKLYGVRAIPSNFLIAPDGTIVGKNLREQELHKKLEEIFSGPNPG